MAAAARAAAAALTVVASGEQPVLHHRQPRHGASLARATQPGADHQVGVAGQHRTGHRLKVGAVEGAVGVGEGDHLGVGGGQHPGPAGRTEAAAVLVDDPGAVGGGHRGGRVGGAVVDHHQVDAWRERRQRGRERVRLVQCRQDDAHAVQVHHPVTVADGSHAPGSRFLRTGDTPCPPAAAG
jgi:hypothetical protein